MNVIQRIYYFFAPYTGVQERAVSLFFGGLTEHSDSHKTRERLYELIQRDIATINLWTEYKYKGYNYLRKSQRKKLYTNLDSIAKDFDAFYTNHKRAQESVASHVRLLNAHARVHSEQIVLLQALMDYFSPHRGVYQYKVSSSFGKLLRNPSHEALIGDCNQIVTLYIYLYSRYFDIRDLKIRLLPEHVALHYQGIDIEATNGTFRNYDQEKGSSIMPIEEIVSVNLLDTTDSYLSTHEVSAESILQASRFAFILSHERKIVTQNLEAAYARLINLLMKRHNYSQALKIAKASRDTELLAIVGHNGAVHNMTQHNYAAARKFAQYSLKSTELMKDSYHAEGIHFYEAHKYHDAIKAFKQYGDQSLVKRCYEALYFDEQQKLPSEFTADSIKKYSAVIKRMHNFAKKSGNKQLINAADHLRKYL